MSTSQPFPTVQTYLSFNGECEKALAYYEKVLGAEIQVKLRFSENPEAGTCQNVPAEKIMHSAFRIGNSQIMASDGGCVEKTQFGGFSLTLNVATVEEAERVFGALAQEGKVIMPVTKTFYSPGFGMVTDPFGITWMIHTVSECQG